MKKKKANREHYDFVLQSCFLVRFTDLLFLLTLFSVSIDLFHFSFFFYLERTMFLKYIYFSILMLGLYLHIQLRFLFFLYFYCFFFPYKFFKKKVIRIRKVDTRKQVNMLLLKIFPLKAEILKTNTKLSFLFLAGPKKVRNFFCLAAIFSYFPG